MVTVKNIGGSYTNWSFSNSVALTTSLDDLKENPSKFVQEQNYFATCSGYSWARGKNKFIIQAPTCYLPEVFCNDKFQNAWMEEIGKMHGNAKWLGFHPYLGKTGSENPVVWHNSNILRTYGRNPSKDVMYAIMKENTWATWELIWDEQHQVRTYNAFCLLRFLWSRHYSKIVDVYFDIKSRLTITKPEPFEMLQMAYYSFDGLEAGWTTQEGRYSAGYGHLPLGAYTQKLISTVTITNYLKGSSGLNNIFTGITNNWKYEEALELIKQRKYKALYERLKK